MPKWVTINDVERAAKLAQPSENGAASLAGTDRIPPSSQGTDGKDFSRVLNGAHTKRQSGPYAEPPEPLAIVAPRPASQTQAPPRTDDASFRAALTAFEHLLPVGSIDMLCGLPNTGVNGNRNNMGNQPSGCPVRMNPTQLPCVTAAQDQPIRIAVDHASTLSVTNRNLHKLAGTLRETPHLASMTHLIIGQLGLCDNHLHYHASAALQPNDAAEVSLIRECPIAPELHEASMRPKMPFPATNIRQTLNRRFIENF